MITKALIKAIGLMVYRGGNVFDGTNDRTDKREIGHSWGELLSEKHWPNDDKWHFTRWSVATFEAARSLGLLKFYARDEYREEDEYCLTDQAYDWFEKHK